MQTRCPRLCLFLLILGFCMLIHVCSIIGIFDIVRQTSFRNFKYPLEVDLVPVVKRIRKEWRPSSNNQFRFDVDKNVQPINMADFPYIIRNKNRCKHASPDLVVLVKSAVSNQEHRSALRQSWMNSELYRSSNFKFCAVFLLGHDPKQDQLQKDLQKEQEKYGDLVQFDFSDSYFNNTYKTMVGFRWAIETVPQAKYLFFTDDDYFVNVWNLWSLTKSTSVKKSRVIAGYIWHSSMPKRYRYSKWHISIDEYPYRQWPTYPTAGSYVVSMDTAIDLYIGMHFTKYLRFDDVFVGIVAYKLNIPTVHDTSFFGTPLFPITALVYRNVIACHMVGSPELVLEAWRNTIGKERYVTK